MVTVEGPAVPLRLEARARLVVLLDGNGGGASYRSSSAGGVTLSRGGVARAATKRDRPFPSSPPLHVF